MLRFTRGAAKVVKTAAKSALKTPPGSPTKVQTPPTQPRISTRPKSAVNPSARRSLSFDNIPGGTLFSTPQRFAGSPAAVRTLTTTTDHLTTTTEFYEGGQVRAKNTEITPDQEVTAADIEKTIRDTIKNSPNSIVVITEPTRILIQDLETLN